MVLGYVVIIGAGYCLLLLYRRWLQHPLKHAVRSIDAMQSGELQEPVTVTIGSACEIREVLEALEGIRNRLHDVVQGIQSSSSDVNALGERLQAQSEELSAGASEQAAGVEELTSTIDGEKEIVEQSAANSTKVQRETEMLVSRVQVATEMIEKVKQSIGQISERIRIINDIASQTNVLALNAAVEAARAGEQGRGFAVVAAEVRKLAENSRAAAEEIVGMVDEGVKQATDASSYMVESASQFGEMNGLVSELEKASESQLAGIEQINSTVHQINSVTQNVASESETLTQSAGELVGHAEKLNATVSYFHV